MKVSLVLLSPFLVQGGVMACDEFYFHRKRRLLRWERIGHPFDTLAFGITLSVVYLLPYSASNRVLFIALAIFSTLLITKDEWVHAKFCSPLEHWLHALLFILHPLTFIAAALLWPEINSPALLIEKALYRGLLLGICVFLFYQIIYWNIYDRNQRVH